jgi:hypothetical protein
VGFVGMIGLTMCSNNYRFEVSVPSEETVKEWGEKGKQKRNEPLRRIKNRNISSYSVKKCRLIPFFLLLPCSFSLF